MYNLKKNIKHHDDQIENAFDLLQQNLIVLNY